MLEEGKISGYTGQNFGNYHLTGLIGRGGFAEVYLGEHIYLKTQAAIKILQTRLSDEEQEGFYAEARTVAHLQHEHIVRVLEFGLKDNSIPYLVMEYAPNGTLRERFPRGRAEPLERIVPALKQVAAALQYAHNENLIHRDIKPENMLLGSHDEVLLSDFGVALMIKDSQHRGVQDVAGTITYMAPEQLQGRPTLASDQYALGVVVYEWLTGERLFRGSFTEIATQHILTAPPSLQERIPGIPASVDAIVLKALAKQPEQRFANILDFVIALEAATQEQSYDGEVANSDVSTAIQSASETPVLVPGRSILQQPERRRTLTVAGKLKLALFVLGVLLIIGGVLAYVLPGVSQANAQQEMQNLYTNATNGAPEIVDPLSAESTFAWLASSDKHCMFKGGALHIASPSAAQCATFYTNLHNFVYQSEMTIIQGKSGGLIFRYALLPNPPAGTYYFTVTAQGEFSLEDKTITYQDGQLFESDLKALIHQRHSAAIKTGLHQTNLLTIIARDSNIYLYINRQFVGSVKDSTSLAGAIGMFCFDSATYDVAFKNIQIWVL